jgi:hypothetical protein
MVASMTWKLQKSLLSLFLPIAPRPALANDIVVVPWLGDENQCGRDSQNQAGTISGVAAVYQRHECHAERKQALDRWGAHIEQFVRTFDRPKEEAKSSAL